MFPVESRFQSALETLFVISVTSDVLCSAESSVQVISPLDWSFLIPEICICLVCVKLEASMIQWVFHKDFFLSGTWTAQVFSAFPCNRAALSRKIPVFPSDSMEC